MPFLEELQRAPQPSHDGVEYRLVLELQMAEQLQCIPQVLAGCFEGGIALRPAAALQRAAPLRTMPAVHYGAALTRQARDGEAPRHGTPVHAVAAVGKHACGRHDAGNVALAGRSIQKRLPRPSCDSRPALPPIRSIALPTMARPIPVPG